MVSRLVSASMRHREIRRQRPRRRRRIHWWPAAPGMGFCWPRRPVPCPLSSRRPCSLRCQKSHPCPTGRGAPAWRPRRTPATSYAGSDRQDATTRARRYLARRVDVAGPPKGERRAARGGASRLDGILASEVSAPASMVCRADEPPAFLFVSSLPMPTAAACGRISRAQGAAAALHCIARVETMYARRF